MRKLLLICLLALFCAPAFSAVTATTSASGASATTVTLTPEQARQALQVLNDPKKRAQIEDTLNAIAAAGVLATPPAPASGASAAAATDGASGASMVAALKSNGLASQLVRQGAHWLKAGGMTVRHSIAVLLDTSSARYWWTVQLSDAHARAKVFGVLLVLVGTLLPAIALEWLARRLLRRARAAIIARREAREARDKAREAAADAASGAAVQADTTAAVPAQPAASMSTPPASSSGQSGARTSKSDKADDGQKEARSKRQAQHHWTTLQRLPSAALQLIVRMLPLVVFIAAASALMSFFTDDGTIQDAALNSMIDLYVICRAIVIAAGFFLQPDAPGLRLLRLPDSWALFMQRWVIRVVSVIGVGGALIEIATALGLSDAAHPPLVKLLALVGHVMVSIMILQCRAPISALLRERTGDTSGGAQRPVTVLAHGLIDLWAWVAVFVVMALWFVWALDVHNGYRTLLHLGGVSLAVLVAARVVSIVLFGALGRLFRAEESDDKRSLVHQHAYRYYPLIRRVVSTLLVVACALVLLQVWGFDVWQFFRPGAIGHRLTSAVVTICVAAVIALVVWEVANVSVEKRLAQWTKSGDLVRAARLRTLVPMLRTALFVVIALVVVLTGLSELGVNTAPLLASASIFGVALGFGSQKLVQDFITGIFLLMENAMQVGDWVTLAGVSGTVEYLSIRTVRLRGGDGSLFTVPFSSVSTVNNTNRGLGNAAVRVSIAYGEDVDLAIATLKEIGAALREDEQFKSGILSDFSFWGVDAVDGASVTLAGQMQCRDTARWGVQREFNRRIFDTFRAKGIEIANPQRSLLVSSGAAGSGSASNSNDDELEGPPRPADRREGAQAEQPSSKSARH
ncbi:mechanosensitive ion channel domain-containing protein [Paraburkholderia phymatum]|uniref:MscS Mechanosensitive ion channel n=1 Tax=Paraburkholderia phymatum (strain DSM 17167 / CIP 108236 / LMG 21445 / STM815) TaxID=391038 RepID=B2JMZ6_PARP8|nr:mechanosensitive ion channel domain-containing protein [Paraburkholderia phymatum]ACC74389.1 MscS Mechanosensitive ion channel [Paraburkholderia phymatum STM815]